MQMDKILNVSAWLQERAVKKESGREPLRACWDRWLLFGCPGYPSVHVLPTPGFTQVEVLVFLRSLDYDPVYRYEAIDPVQTAVLGGQRVCAIAIFTNVAIKREINAEGMNSSFYTGSSIVCFSFGFYACATKDWRLAFVCLVLGVTNLFLAHGAMKRAQTWEEVRSA